jgi:multiple sugar transport system permease protein
VRTPVAVVARPAQAGVTVKRRSRRFATDQLLGIMLVAPACIVVLVVLLYPVVYNIGVSFQSWSWNAPLEQRGIWVGLGNYARLLDTPGFKDAWLNTTRFVLLSVILEYAVGLAMALVMDARIAGRALVRTSFLVPMMLAPVVVGIQWRWLLSGSFGVVNFALSRVGFNPPSWLSDPTYSMYMVIAADVWEHAPFIALILLAALQSIPADIYDAARVDGASAVQVFRDVTFPLIGGASLIAVVIRFGDLLKSFDLIYSMTGGGPAGTTQVASVYTFNLGFSQGELGQAAAVANVVALIALVAGAVMVARIKTHAGVL